MAPEYTIDEKELCARLKTIDEITNHDIQRAANTFSRCIIGSRCVRQEHTKIFRLIHEVEIRMLQDILRGMKEVPEKEMFRDYSSCLEYISDEVATQLEGNHFKYVLIPKPAYRELRDVLYRCARNGMIGITTVFRWKELTRFLTPLEVSFDNNPYGCNDVVKLN